jgi:hypothetical protein
MTGFGHAAIGALAFDELRKAAAAGYDLANVNPEALKLVRDEWLAAVQMRMALEAFFADDTEKWGAA